MSIAFVAILAGGVAATLAIALGRAAALGDAAIELEAREREGPESMAARRARERTPPEAVASSQPSQHTVSATAPSRHPI